jgi:hypothetical protein
VDLNLVCHIGIRNTPTSHIFKLPIGFLRNSTIDLRQSSENEWQCLSTICPNCKTKGTAGAERFFRAAETAAGF